MTPSQRAGGFGTSIAFSGLDMFVGAPGSQTVWVYPIDGMGGDEQPFSPDATFNMMATFGTAVAADGDVAVVGAPGEDFFEGVGFILTRSAPRTWSHASRVIDDPMDVASVTGEEMHCEDGSLASLKKVAGGPCSTMTPRSVK